MSLLLSWRNAAFAGLAELSLSFSAPASAQENVNCEN
jgi:hypothetical protein